MANPNLFVNFIKHYLLYEVVLKLFITHWRHLICILCVCIDSFHMRKKTDHFLANADALCIKKKLRLFSAYSKTHLNLFVK